jgi:hypothetical protein
MQGENNVLKSKLPLENNYTIHHSQALISIIILCLYFGFPSLYATLVCVACSQLEKLRAELLDIGQTHLMSEQDCGDWARQTDGPGRAHTSDEVFRHMQQKLKDCIRHHQQIKRCGYN